MPHLLSPEQGSSPRVRIADSKSRVRLLSRLQQTIDDFRGDREDAGNVELTRGPDAAESIGQRLRRLRLERGLSQRELAGPGVSYAYISRIEAGARRPSVKALRMLAPKLGVSVEYLETGSELRESDERELRLADAELQLRLADDPSEAEATLTTLLDEAMRAGDTLLAARAEVALGYAADRRGDHAAAAARLESALESGAFSVTAHPDVYATLGRAYAALGTPARAVELFEQCLDELDDAEPDHSTAYVRFTVALSQALSDLGDLDRAQEAVRAALGRSKTVADPYARIRLYWSLARLEAHRGRPLAALEGFRRAVALLEATEDTLQLARAHVACAWTLIAADRADEARPHLELAERLFGPHPDPLDLAYLRTEQAKQAVQLGDGDDAVRRAQEALDVLGDSDPHEQGSAWCALAQGLALQGQVSEADAAFRRSVDLLEEHGQRRECAEALRAWAKLLREAGRESEALDVLERAAALAPAEQTRARVRS